VQNAPLPETLPKANSFAEPMDLRVPVDIADLIDMVLERELLMTTSSSAPSSTNSHAMLIFLKNIGHDCGNTISITTTVF
jgi:hypothetical protein